MRDLGLLELFAERTAERPAFTRLVDMPAVVEHLSESLKRELDFRQEAANIERMRGVLEPYSRLGRPGRVPRALDARLLVMQEIEGGPVREAPEGPLAQGSRAPAARVVLPARS